MTKREREQVVELLRCAADRLLEGASMIAPFTDTVQAIHGDRYADPRSLASARDLMHDIVPCWWNTANSTETAMAALEAAARVEEGRWLK